MNSPIFIILQLLLCVAFLIASILMVSTVISAGKGKIVAINTITGIGLTGIVLSVLMVLFSFLGGMSDMKASGVIMLAASIMYRMSVKNFKLAKIGAILAICAMVVMPFLFFFAIL